MGEDLCNCILCGGATSDYRGTYCEHCDGYVCQSCDADAHKQGHAEEEVAIAQNAKCEKEGHTDDCPHCHECDDPEEDTHDCTCGCGKKHVCEECVETHFLALAEQVEADPSKFDLASERVKTAFEVLDRVHAAHLKESKERVESSAVTMELASEALRTATRKHYQIEASADAEEARIAERTAKRPRLAAAPAAAAASAASE